MKEFILIVRFSLGMQKSAIISNIKSDPTNNKGEIMRLCNILYQTH